MFTRLCAFLLSFLLVIFLSACGGGGAGDGAGGGAGGGGGGGAGGGDDPITLSTNHVTFTCTRGGIGTSPVEVSITGRGYINVEFSGNAIRDAALSINSETSGTLTIWPDLSHSGNVHNGLVVLDVCADQFCSDILKTYQITVSLTVTGSIISPGNNFFFNNPIGAQAPAAQSLIYEDEAHLSYSWTTEVNYQNGDGWLIVSPSTGASLPAHASLSVDPGNLPEGTYSALVNFASSAGTSAVFIEYTVEPPTLSTATASLDMSVDAATTPADMFGIITLQNSGDPVQWQASVDAPWLSLGSIQGTATGTNTVVVQIIDTELYNLPNGIYNGTVTFSYSNRPDVNFSVPVTLNLNAPLISQVAQHVGFTGQPGDLVIRGDGFDAIAGQTLSIGGNTIDSYTFVNDTEIRISYPGLAAGSYSVTVTDNLGLARSLDNLVIVDPANYSYTAISALYSKSQPVYDPVRQAVYTVDFVGGDLHVFRYDNGSWIHESQPIEDALRVALSNDGQSIVVTVNNSFTKLHRLDPDTLVVEYSGMPQLGSNYTFGDIIPVNDGRLMMGNSSGSFVLYDPRDDSYLQGIQFMPLADASTNSATLTGTLDGDRVFMARTGFVTANSIKIFDFSDISAITTSTMLYAKQLSTDHHGTRLLVNPADGSIVDVYHVDTQDISLEGSLDAGLEAIALSPDGAQAFAYDFIDGDPAQHLIRVYDLSSPDGMGGYAKTNYSLPEPQGGVNSTKLTVSTDGNTLFLGSNSHLVVWPIP